MFNANDFLPSVSEQLQDVNDSVREGLISEDDSKYIICSILADAERRGNV